MQFKTTLAVLLIGLSSTAIAEADWDTYIERTGDVLAVALPLTALTATYTLQDLDGRKQLLTSYAAALSLTYAGKFAIGKERPDGSNNLGFPSAHTSSAFSGASFLAKRYGWDIGVPAYLAASFVGYSRVHANKHDWWDVTAGAALAMGINEWLVSERSDVNVALLPLEGGAQLAFSVRY